MKGTVTKIIISRSNIIRLTHASSLKITLLLNIDFSFYSNRKRLCPKWEPIYLHLHLTLHLSHLADVLIQSDLLHSLWSKVLQFWGLPSGSAV
jgi:hypothetical protein